MKILSIILFVGLLVNQSIAQENDSLRAQANYNQGGLNIIAVLINDKTFFDDWQKPQMPKIRSVETYKRGEQVLPIIIFSTDGKDNNGNANLSYDIKILKPDGSIYGEFKQLNIWKDAKAPAMHLLQQPIGIGLEEKDPLGVYNVEIIVYENNKNQKVELALQFQVVNVISTPVMQPKSGNEELNNNFNGYFLHPDYTVLCRQMKLYDGVDEIQNTANSRMPMMGFFVAAFNGTVADSADLRYQIRTKYARNEFLQQCYEMSRNIDVFEKSIGKEHGPGVNDLFWGAFFGSGDKKYIERIATELQYVNEKDSLKFYLAGASAKWSLSSNAKQYPTVKKYLEEIEENASPYIKDQIELLLSTDPADIKTEMSNHIKKYQSRLIK